MSDPTRTHRVGKAYRTKRVVAGKIKKPNPAYAEAVNELAEAREEHARKLAESQEFHNRAAEARASGGVAGAVTAAAFETTAAGLAVAANKILDDARGKEATTPKTITENVEAEARYPVVTLETTAKVTFHGRLDGLGDVIDDGFEVSTTARAEQIAPAPSLGLLEAQADLASLAALTPDYSDALAQAAGRLADRVREREEASAWQAFLAARANADVGRAALTAASYLAISLDASPHRAEVIEFLVRSLP